MSYEIGGLQQYWVEYDTAETTRRMVASELLVEATSPETAKAQAKATLESDPANTNVTIGAVWLADEENEEPEVDLSGCLYYRHVEYSEPLPKGFQCGSCWTEPSCITDQPPGGWPGDPTDRE